MNPDLLVTHKKVILKVLSKTFWLFWNHSGLQRENCPLEGDAQAHRNKIKRSGISFQNYISRVSLLM